MIGFVINVSLLAIRITLGVITRSPAFLPAACVSGAAAAFFAIAG